MTLRVRVAAFTAVLLGGAVSASATGLATAALAHTGDSNRVVAVDVAAPDSGDPGAAYYAFPAGTGDVPAVPAKAAPTVHTVAAPGVPAVPAVRMPAVTNTPAILARPMDTPLPGCNASNNNCGLPDCKSSANSQQCNLLNCVATSGCGLGTCSQAGLGGIGVSCGLGALGAGFSDCFFGLGCGLGGFGLGGCGLFSLSGCGFDPFGLGGFGLCGFGVGLGSHRHSGDDDCGNFGFGDLGFGNFGLCGSHHNSCGFDFSSHHSGRRDHH